MAKPREWTVLGDPETGELDREAVVQNLIDMEAVGQLLGGVFNLAPIRHQVGDEYRTIGWVFRWHSTAPAVRQDPPKPAVEPADDEASGAS